MLGLGQYCILKNSLIGPFIELRIISWCILVVDNCLGWSPQYHHPTDHLDQINPADIILVDICGSEKEKTKIIILFPCTGSYACALCVISYMGHMYILFYP